MMNETIKNMLSHRSIRSYQERPVPEEDLNQIIAAVQAAPNWVNLQHVSVIAVKEPERRKKFAQLCGEQGQIAQAPVFLVFCADYYRTHLACKMEGQSLDEVLWDINHLIVGAHEVGIAAGTAVAAAESLDLGTVVIGDVRLHALEAVKELHLPRYVIPLLGLCIGYPADDPGLKPRLPKEAVYFEETYRADLEGLLRQYDARYSQYLQKRPWNSRVGIWTQMAADFYRAPYRHYPEVSEMLRKQGFPDGNISLNASTEGKQKEGS